MTDKAYNSQTHAKDAGFDNNKKTIEHPDQLRKALYAISELTDYTRHEKPITHPPRRVLFRGILRTTITGFGMNEYSKEDLTNLCFYLEKLLIGRALRIQGINA